jgi:death-on-curing protein
MSERTDPIWLDARDLLTVHDRQLVLHGGGAGVRSMDLLESAVARPQNLWGYGEPDAASLAASYAFGIARNHPFVDGNKRTAWVAARLFLRVNGHLLQHGKEESIRIMLDLAAGLVEEEVMAGWLRERLSRT